MPLPILLAGLLLIPQADRWLAPDPRYPWVVAGLTLAYREGQITGYPDLEPSSWRQRPASRYEYVVAIHAAATNQLNRAEAFFAHPASDLERASLIRSAVLLPFYKRADKEFKKELVSLGIADDFGQARLAEFTRQIEATAPARDRPFRDVSADHWAAKAVGDLRALGLLDGYPDERFRGR